MKAKIPVIIGILLVMVLCIPGVSAASPWQVHGAHYNLNIIGVDNPDHIVGDSDGHTMFVKLSGKTKILMTQDVGGDFQVVDRNGLDGQTKFNIAPGYYNIYAIPHGKPGNHVDINAWGNFTDAETGYQLINLGYVNIARTSGKPQVVNINELFYVDVTLCVAYDDDLDVCTQWVEYRDYWVFAIDELIEYWWDYDNDGLKQLQVRFYACTLDASGEAADFCRDIDGNPIISTKTLVPFL
jgi:hypothetical protein